MMTLKISTGNAAFDDVRGECARILRELAARVDAGSEERIPIFDINGNRVGQFNLTTRR